MPAPTLKRVTWGGGQLPSPPPPPHVMPPLFTCANVSFKSTAYVYLLRTLAPEHSEESKVWGGGVQALFVINGLSPPPPNKALSAHSVLVPVTETQLFCKWQPVSYLMKINIRYASQYFVIISVNSSTNAVRQTCANFHCLLKRMIPRSFHLVWKYWFYNHFLKRSHLQILLNLCKLFTVGMAVHKFSLCFVRTDQWASGQQCMEVKKANIPDWNVMRMKRELTMTIFEKLP